MILLIFCTTLAIVNVLPKAKCRTLRITKVQTHYLTEMALTGRQGDSKISLWKPLLYDTQIWGSTKSIIVNEYFTNPNVLLPEIENICESVHFHSPPVNLQHGVLVYTLNINPLLGRVKLISYAKPKVKTMWQQDGFHVALISQCGWTKTFKLQECYNDVSELHFYLSSSKQYCIPITREAGLALGRNMAAALYIYGI